MKFSAYKYQRPDFPVYQETFKKALANLQSADTFSEAKQALDALNELRGTIDTAMNLASIRYSIDTNDAFYEAEDTFWNEYQPHFEALDFQFYQALLASPVLDELKAEYPETLFLFAESRVKLFDEALIELFQKENQLASDTANWSLLPKSTSKEKPIPSHNCDHLPKTKIAVFEKKRLKNNRLSSRKMKTVLIKFMTRWSRFVPRSPISSALKIMLPLRIPK